MIKSLEKKEKDLESSMGMNDFFVIIVILRTRARARAKSVE